MDLQGIVAPADWPKIQEIREKFAAEKNGAQDRNVLAELHKQALSFEMRYLPMLSQSIQKALPNEKRALFILVGFSEGPILISMAIIQPEKAVLIHTKESQRTVESILSNETFKALLKDRVSLEPLFIDPLDSAQTYRDLVRIVEKKENKSYSWICDITGGKKAMSGTLAAFGFWRRIPVLYLDSVEVKGITEPFSENLYLLKNPYDCYGDPVLQTAEKALQRFDFASALSALQTLLDTTSFQEQYHKTEMAIQVIRLYHQWDRFAHSEPNKEYAGTFYATFEKTLQTCQRLNHQFISPDEVEDNLTFLKGLKKAYEPNKPALLDPYRLIDLLRNAERRGIQESYDDAVARLYRCIEMAASLLLSRLIPDFDPGSADWEALRKQFVGCDLDALYRQKSKECGERAEGLPKLKRVGLAVQIVLGAVIAEAAKQYPERFSDQQKQDAKKAQNLFGIYKDHSSQNDGIFARRNRSILAHGSRPVEKQTFEKFLSVAKEICKLTVSDDWQMLYTQSKFPVFRLTE
ncbi:MAG TPA: TIGR02710 family CRISPR-associated CARF protein [Anaerohalosphaeraceae bacterium]|nr:TIGR02710 family CRISPR-associated CARF protein [Anaerohalosphaeraceae bacterium]